MVILAGISVSAAVGVTASGREVTSDTITQNVQTVVQTLFSGDHAAVQSLLRFTRVPCQADQANPSNPNPACPDGQAVGTSIEALPVGACEGAYDRADQLTEVVNILAAPGPQLFGVYRAAAQPIALMSGEFAAVYTGLPGTTAPGAVWIANGGISSVELGCAESTSSPAGFVTHYGLQGPLAKQEGGQLPSTGQGGDEPWARQQFAIWGLLAVACATFAITVGLKRARLFKD